ncbi:ester cyclase [Pollutibacter soli]|uniref:ester cyclase n=1 Tax=Pollutibacter soli TaxID=3034157 RepID=UPI003013DC43
MKREYRSVLVWIFTGALLIAGCESEKNDGMVEENIRIYSNAWDEIANKGNLLVFDSAFAPAVVYDNVTTHLQGVDAVRKYFSEYVTGFSNRDFKVLEIYGQGDHVIKRWSFTGTHTGDFAGIKPTGKRITVEGVTIARMVNGKITEERDYADDLGLMQKLGVIPPM